MVLFLMLGFQQFSPPSDEGGAEGRGGGREKRDKSINKAFLITLSRLWLLKSLSFSLRCRQLPRQREPNETPTFAKEPNLYIKNDQARQKL